MAKNGDLRRLDEGTRQIHKTLSSIDHHRRDLDIFRDFLALARMSLVQVANRLTTGPDPKIEAQYESIRSRYAPEKFALFAKTLGQLSTVLDATDEDVLGRVFMALNLGSDYAGQFFTPLHVARMMAEITIEGIEKRLETAPYITMNEPAAGSGAMVIAMAQAMRERGINPQIKLKATLVDIDRLCCDMAFVQLSLLGLRANVIHGNSLSLETWDDLKTPWWWAPVGAIALVGERDAEEGVLASFLNRWKAPSRSSETAPRAERQKLPKPAAAKRPPRAAE